MSDYKLYYFNAMGRAETARMLFALKAVPFTDQRVSGEEWAKLKPGMPMGQLPVLEKGDFQLSQSGAINSYLARELGAYGKGSQQTAKIDEIAGCVGDIGVELYKVMFAKSDDDKKSFAEGKLPDWMKKFEKIVTNYEAMYENKAEITLAEIATFNVIVSIKNQFPDVQVPSKIQAFADKVAENSNLNDWLKRRPDTKM